MTREYKMLGVEELTDYPLPTNAHVAMDSPQTKAAKPGGKASPIRPKTTT